MANSFDVTFMVCEWNIHYQYKKCHLSTLKPLLIDDWRRLQPEPISGCWFQTFFMFHNIWENPSHSLIFFNMVKSTNQMMMMMTTMTTMTMTMTMTMAMMMMMVMMMMTMIMHEPDWTWLNRESLLRDRCHDCHDHEWPRKIGCCSLVYSHEHWIIVM